MTPSILRQDLELLVREAGLDKLINSEPRFQFVEKRLEAMFRIFRTRRLRHQERTDLPLSQSWADFMNQWSGNPHRVKLILNAIAAMCSGEMLAMLWMVQLGAEIRAIRVDYELEQRVELSVTIELPGDDPSNETFTSNEIWDLALLRFSALAEVNNLPVVSNFTMTH